MKADLNKHNALQRKQFYPILKSKFDSQEVEKMTLTIKLEPPISGILIFHFGKLIQNIMLEVEKSSYTRLLEKN
jgi:hypothetical protein